jgi:translocation and assembly module TamA
LNYKIPLWEPEHEYATISSRWKRSDNDDIRGTALELGFAYHRRNESGWEQVGSLTYLDEKTEVDGEDPINSQLTLLGVNTNKTVRDDALFPTKGWRLKANLKGAVEGVISDQSILQAEVTGKFLHTFGDADNDDKQLGKIILQGGIGTTVVGEFTEMPKSLRFFAGGQNSVRGYSFESLGETDTDGNVLGGKHKLTVSIEYEHPVMENISAAVFVDAGNAFNEFDDFSLEAGYGIGVRYKSPLGPIRVDFAVPEDNTSDVNLYFSLGADL